MAEIAFIGFGEAAAALLHDLGIPAAAFDLRFSDTKARAAAARSHPQLQLCDQAGGAAAGAGIIFSLVTAEQAVNAANSIGPLQGSPIYLDANSCSPAAKREAAAIMRKFGARYVDLAVMAPVSRGIRRIPMLASGPHAGDAVRWLRHHGLQASELEGRIGTAAAVKLLRSIVVKGLQTLLAEASLAARSESIEDAWLASLEETWPGMGWAQLSETAHIRMRQHGRRRAEEMRQSAEMLRALDLPDIMAKSIAEWQDLLEESDLQDALRYLPEQSAR
ncbi:MAG: DUF1932 domain-containing protein [Rhodobacteraceae bacterium]|nr:DUF1932 domain-containing protein [Paracoccaceae bacterium]